MDAEVDIDWGRDGEFGGCNWKGSSCLPMATTAEAKEMGRLILCLTLRVCVVEALQGKEDGSRAEKGNRQPVAGLGMG